MARYARPLERMTRHELMAEVRRLRRASGGQNSGDRIRHDCRADKAQMGSQRDQLIAQRQLERSRDVYADLYDYAPLPYVTLDENGVVRNINLTGAALLARGRAAIVGTPFSRHVGYDDRRRFLEHMRRCRAETGPITTDLMLLVPGGDAIPVQLTSRPSVPPGATAAEHRTAIVDVRMLRAAEVARVQAERDRVRLVREEERLRAAMEAKDEFLAVLSHELRTPLTPVLALASALQMRADLPPELRDHLARMQRSIELETRLIDDLLDMTRAARGALSLSREVVDVHELLRETVELCDADRPSGIAITCALGASQHRVRADPLRLRQVFWNLLRNTFQSIEGEGRVLLRSINDPPGRISVVVRDSGRGIEPADLDRVFLPFYQPRGGKHGRLGLGLAIAKSIVEAHDGRITATSAGLGQGACFEVELSVTDAGEVDSRPTSSNGPVRSEEAAPPRLAILLVEDNADSAEALSLALQLQGYEVRLAGSVAAAREAARERFDVLVSDLALPDGDGIELLTEPRARISVPAIALSGHGTEVDKSRTASAGFSAHLTKPVTIERLSETIRRLVPPA
jgi:signal transduction histidine kinase/CheY-like chemotaxis protein